MNYYRTHHGICCKAFKALKAHKSKFQPACFSSSTNNMVTAERDIGVLGVKINNSTTKFKIFILWDLKIKTMH